MGNIKTDQQDVKSRNSYKLISQIVLLVQSFLR